VESATLIEIAFGRVERVLAGVQALLEALELIFPGVERALPSLDGRLEVYGLSLA
jgi:hypothetical protein